MVYQRSGCCTVCVQFDSLYNLMTSQCTCTSSMWSMYSNFKLRNSKLKGDDETRCIRLAHEQPFDMWSLERNNWTWLNSEKTFQKSQLPKVSHLSYTRMIGRDIRMCESHTDKCIFYLFARRRTASSSSSSPPSEEASFTLPLQTSKSGYEVSFRILSWNSLRPLHGSEDL